MGNSCGKVWMSVRNAYSYMLSKIEAGCKYIAEQVSNMFKCAMTFFVNIDKKKRESIWRSKRTSDNQLEKIQSIVQALKTNVTETNPNMFRNESSIGEMVDLVSSMISLISELFKDGFEDDIYCMCNDLGEFWDLALGILQLIKIIYSKPVKIFLIINEARELFHRKGHNLTVKELVKMENDFFGVLEKNERKAGAFIYFALKLFAM